MIKNMRILFPIFFLIFFLLCCSENSQLSSIYSDSLLVLNGASKVRYEKLNGTEQLYYEIITEYPTKNSIAELNRELEAKGWTPLEYDWLNPEIPSSHVRGWTNFIDGTKEPNLKVHSWHSNWKNEKEDILVYVLRYSYPVNTSSNMLSCNVTAIYVPENIAKESVSQLKVLNK